MDNAPYSPSTERYKNMLYKRCGASGLKLPMISLGLWHNFGHVDTFHNCRAILRTAYDIGITHFDLANNYGPPPGSAEENFGKIVSTDFRQHRDELIISTKAGYTMWDGPYGDWGSKKYLVSSLDQSLKRMKLDYVDIFYHHRPDPETPMEETADALTLIHQQGKALYIGISNYKAPEADRMISLLKERGLRCLIHQPKYSMFERSPENGLLDVLGKHGVGCIPFSPLAQGLLTDKYLHGIPKDSRAGKEHTFLKQDQITPQKLQVIQKLNVIAGKRGQSLAQMAIAWLLKDPRITTVLIGVSKPTQIADSVKAIENFSFTSSELHEIENTLALLK
jgi:L-glyceraldehyde 3-phosphate reductase